MLGEHLCPFVDEHAMQSRIASHEAFVLTQRFIGLFSPCAACPLTPVRHLKTEDFGQRTRSFLGAGLAYKSTSRLRMARWHRDQGPMALLRPAVSENPEDR